MDCWKWINSDTSMSLEREQWDRKIAVFLFALFAKAVYGLALTSDSEPLTSISMTNEWLALTSPNFITISHSLIRHCHSISESADWVSQKRESNWVSQCHCQVTQSVTHSLTHSHWHWPSDRVSARDTGWLVTLQCVLSEWLCQCVSVTDSWPESL